MYTTYKFLWAYNDPGLNFGFSQMSQVVPIETKGERNYAVCMSNAA